MGQRIGSFGWIECATMCLWSWQMPRHEWVSGDTMNFIFIDHLLLFCAEKYPQAGQNIAKRGSTAGFDDANKAASKMIYKWFSEYEDTDHSTIKAYQKSSAWVLCSHSQVRMRLFCHLIEWMWFQQKDRPFYCYRQWWVQSCWMCDG